MKKKMKWKKIRIMKKIRIKIINKFKHNKIKPKLK